MGLMFVEFRLDSAAGHDQDTGTTAVNRHHTLASVTDGLATTVMLSENVNAGLDSAAGWTKNARFANVESNWACPHPYNTSFFVNGTAVKVFDVAREEKDAGSTGYRYCQANNRGANAFPAGPGNEGGINGDLSGTNEGRFPYPNSYHHGGVLVSMCDGSTRFISESIAPEVWARLVTPAGGEIVDPVTGEVGGAALESNGRGYTQQMLSEEEL